MKPIVEPRCHSGTGLHGAIGALDFFRLPIFELQCNTGTGATRNIQVLHSFALPDKTQCHHALMLLREVYCYVSICLYWPFTQYYAVHRYNWQYPAKKTPCCSLSPCHRGSTLLFLFFVPYKLELCAPVFSFACFIGITFVTSNRLIGTIAHHNKFIKIELMLIYQVIHHRPGPG